MKAIKKDFLPIYGKGKQKKPFIDLEDVVDSLYNVYKKNNSKKFEIYNQFSQTLSIIEISNLIKEVSKNYGFKTVIKNIQNPRKENEEHNMKMENAKFLKILGRKPKSILQSIKESFKDLV